MEKFALDHREMERMLIMIGRILDEAPSRTMLEEIADYLYAGGDISGDWFANRGASRFAAFINEYRTGAAGRIKQARFSWHGYPVVKPGIPPIGSSIEKNVLINRYLDPGNRHTAGSMTVALGYNCPLDCKQCYVSAFRDPKRVELTVQEFGALFDRIIHEAGVWHIDITGGEPLDHPHFFDIIETIPEERATAIVATNGLGLTPQTVNHIRGTNIMAFKVSLESCAVTSPSRVMQGIRLLVENRILTFVQSYVERGCSENDRLETLIRTVKDTGADSIHLITPLMTGNLDHGQDLLLTRKDREHLYLLQQAFWKTDGFGVGIFPDWELENGGCSAGRRRVYISAYGDVYPCNFHNATCYGNILKNDIRDMLSAMQRDIPEPPCGCIASNVTRDVITDIRQKLGVYVP